LGVIELMISATLQCALVASSFAEQYYELCAKHPLQSAPSLKSTNAEVLAALADLGSVSKLKGPGRIFKIAGAKLQPSIDFSFIIQGAGGVVEPCLGLTENGVRSGTNFAVLAFSASAEVGAPAPMPAYPRPFVHSLAELRAIVAGAFELAVLVSAKVPQA
jgi:hypothetical protein